MAAARRERERKDVCILRHVNDDDLLKRKKLERGRGFLALLALLSKLIFSGGNKVDIQNLKVFMSRSILSKLTFVSTA